MKHPLRLLALAGAIIATMTTACQAGDPPFEASLRVERDVSVIQLQAVANHAVLTDFKVNRGNCKTKLGGIDPLPLTFKFGNGVKLFAYSCSVKEVSVVTNQGSFTYSFGR